MNRHRPAAIRWCQICRICRICRICLSFYNTVQCTPGSEEISLYFTFDGTMALGIMKDSVSYPYSYDMFTMVTLTKEQFDDFERHFIVDEPWMITWKEAVFLLNRHNKVNLEMVQHWEDEYWPRYGFHDEVDGPYRKDTVLCPLQKARFLLWRYSKTHDNKYLIHGKKPFLYVRKSDALLCRRPSFGNSNSERLYSHGIRASLSGVLLRRHEETSGVPLLQQRNGRVWRSYSWWSPYRMFVSHYVSAD